MTGIQKQQYVIRRVGKKWEVIFLATGRSVGQRYTRVEARELKNQCNRDRKSEQLDAVSAPRG